MAHPSQGCVYVSGMEQEHHLVAKRSSKLFTGHISSWSNDPALLGGLLGQRFIPCLCVPQQPLEAFPLPCTRVKEE